MARPPLALRRIAGGRLWFWKPQSYWFGWRTLVPFRHGHDEYGRRTLLFGWTITGRAIFAYRWCGDVECYAEAIREARHG